MCVFDHPLSILLYVYMWIFIEPQAIPFYKFMKYKNKMVHHMKFLQLTN